jgi:hypothetical protein
MIREVRLAPLLASDTTAHAVSDPNPTWCRRAFPQAGMHLCLSVFDCGKMSALRPRLPIRPQLISTSHASNRSAPTSIGARGSNDALPTVPPA